MNFTRQDYMSASPENRSAAYHQYYLQFVTPAVLNIVAHRIGQDRIRQSKDEHFNDIPLIEWDRMEPRIKDLCLSKMGDINGAESTDKFGSRRIAWSLGDAVCIAKAAARVIRDEAA